VLQSLTPGQALVKVVHDELVHIMGEANDELQLNVQPPAVVLMAGLQGSGKTTSTAKLARWLKERRKEVGHGHQLRRVSPGGHRAAAHPGRRGGRGLLPQPGRPGPGAIARRRWMRPAGSMWTC
jgi:energy-coupling factor transporter ATP-binding protein EcfA2